MATAGFQAGAACVDITPPVGTPMGGFAARTHGATGVHDPLKARAIAISDGTGALLLITCDLLSLPYDVVDEMHAAIGKACGLVPEQILINTSHTHSGPLIRGMKGMGQPDAVYAANLAAMLSGLAQMAMADMQPVTLSLHQGPLQVGVNRRQRTAAGGTVLGRNPELPADRTVPGLRADRVDGTPVAILFSHAAHGVVLGSRNYLISGDWMGYALRDLERVYPGTLVAFAQGCCGNVNPQVVQGTFTDAQRLGRRAAGGVIMAAESDGMRLTPRVATARCSIHLPQFDPPPIGEAEEQVQQAENILREAEETEDQARLQYAQAFFAWSVWLRNLTCDGGKNRAMRLDVSAAAIGPCAIVGMAGEVFYEYSTNIAAASPFDATMVWGTTNGCAAYLPTAAEIPFGGYEVDSAMRYYRQLRLKPDAELLVQRETQVLLQRLHGA